MATRDELIVALAKRYRRCRRREKGLILDEFVALTGFHRKHAMRLLRSGSPHERAGPRPGRRSYGEAVREALVLLWEAADRVCGKRLKPLLPILFAAMERNGHLRLPKAVRSQLLSISAATIDRALHDVREAAGGRRRRHAAPSAAVRRSVPVRTFADWHDPPPGFFEADLVAHSGPSARGSFVQTLVLTDIATGWTECAPLLVREQTLLVEALKQLGGLIPFAVRGFDSDNDSVFMNETVRDYCQTESITFTRCRPYRKNDQAWVEQKNGAVVRRIVGYRRFEGTEAAATLAQLYGSARLFVNFFQPSFKLAAKTRDGARIKKTYHPPATPCQRLLADPHTPAAVRRRVQALRATLDPVRLLSQMRATQQRLVEIADRPIVGHTVAAAPPPLEQFLSNLRTAWQGGEARPTARAKEKAKRGRRRPDPFASVSEQLRAWFDSDPTQTGRELFNRLQSVHPDVYPVGQLRTLQRRLKAWRQDTAQQMIFPITPAPAIAESPARISGVIANTSTVAAPS
jgi:hypothetical protein